MANTDTPTGTNKFKNILMLFLSAAGIFYAVQNWDTMTDPSIVTDNEQQTEQIQEPEAETETTEIPSTDKMTTVDLSIDEEQDAKEIAEVIEKEVKAEVKPKVEEKKVTPKPYTPKKKKKVTPNSDTDNSDAGNQRLTYDGKDLILTRHAKCRMGCREISKAEVAEVIREGKINKRKSNPDDPRGCPVIALEDVTEDGQLVRIIVANCDRVAKLVTVIDLKNNYKCTCK